MKTASAIFAHDWLAGMRGGERVLESLLRLFPRAQIYTLLHNPAAISDAINAHAIHASWLQQVPGIQRFYRHALPFFPRAMERLRVEPAEILISISHCVAKGVIPQPGTRHLCYCLTPMRYAWCFYEEYFGTNPIKKTILKPILARLREWDRETSQRVDHFITISRHVQKRIKEFYGRDADVIYPPVNTTYWTPAADPTQRPDKLPKTYDLIVSALVPYKRVDLAVKAYAHSDSPLIVAGRGPEAARLQSMAGKNIYFMRDLPDQMIRELYRHCRMLLFPGEEDFGIVPLEAQACGIPVVAFGRGGALETVADGQSGVFFPEQSPDALLDAVARCAEHTWDGAAIRAHAQQFDEAVFLEKFQASIQKARGK